MLVFTYRELTTELTHCPEPSGFMFGCPDGANDEGIIFQLGFGYLQFIGDIKSALAEKEK